MAQAGKGKLNYRCPLCFMRDLDIDIFQVVLARTLYMDKFLHRCVFLQSLFRF